MRRIIALALLLTGCRTQLLAPRDLAAPPDPAPPLCNGLACAADEFCLHPCNDLIYCYHTADAGCRSGDYLVDCQDDAGLGCTFDDRPNCVKSSCADCQSCTGCASCFTFGPRSYGCTCP